jgi:putative exporter of polyketide antibiotics
VRWGALTVMAVLASVLTVPGVVLFTRRDIGAPIALPMLHFPERRRPDEIPFRAWSLQSVFARNLSTAARSAMWWSVAVGCYTLMLTTLLRQLQHDIDDLIADLVRSNPLRRAHRQRHARRRVTMNMAMLNPVHAARGDRRGVRGDDREPLASEEEAGRFDLVLAQPEPRRSVMLTHFAATALR